MDRLVLCRILQTSVKFKIKLLNSIAILRTQPGIVTSKFRQYFGFNPLSFASVFVLLRLDKWLAFAMPAGGTVIVRLGSLK